MNEITKSRLKEIILEELMKEGPPPVDSGALKSAGDGLKAVVGSTVKDSVPNRNIAISTAKTVASTFDIMLAFEKIFRSYEEQTNTRLDAVEEQRLPEIEKAIKALTAAVKELGQAVAAAKPATTAKPATPSPSPTTTPADKTQDYIDQLKSKLELGPRE